MISKNKIIKNTCPHCGETKSVFTLVNAADLKEEFCLCGSCGHLFFPQKEVIT
jgi:transcription elongation factor Elf1